MFDLSRLGETLSGFLGSVAQAPAEAANLTDVLQSVGLDPSVIAGLSETEIGSLLAGYGIDVSQFDPAEITQLAENLGWPPGGDAVNALWGDGGHEN